LVLLVSLWTFLAISTAHAGKPTKPSLKHGDPGSRLRTDAIEKERSKARRKRDEPAKHGKNKKDAVRIASWGLSSFAHLKKFIGNCETCIAGRQEKNEVPQEEKDSGFGPFRQVAMCHFCMEMP
jgi:hypothetical protein